MLSFARILGTLLLTASFANAAGNHTGGHDSDMGAGEPGKASEVTRVIKVIMDDAPDGGMIFEPSQFQFRKGETIRFDIENRGETDHEFVLEDYKGMHEHRMLMVKFPEMEHDDPNSVRLAPGGKGEVIWKFTKSGEFQFACLIPGHMEAGMHGPIKVD